MVQMKKFVFLFTILCISQYSLLTKAEDEIAKNEADEVKSRKRRDATLGTLGSLLGPVLGLVTEAEYKAMLQRIMAILEDQKNVSGIVDKQSSKSQADFQRVDNRIDRQGDQMQEIRAKMGEISSSLKNILLFQKAFAKIQNLDINVLKLDDRLNEYSKILDSIINALRNNNKSDGVTEKPK